MICGISVGGVRNRQVGIRETSSSSPVVEMVQHTSMGQQVHACSEESSRHRGLRQVRYGGKRIRPRVFNTNGHVATFSRNVTVQGCAMRWEIVRQQAYSE